MKTYTITTLFITAIVLAGCQSAKVPSPTTPILPGQQKPAPTVTHGVFPRRFYVAGNSFVDQDGLQMIFRGINCHDPAIMDMGNPVDPRFSAEYFRAIASWGANIIRVPITPFSLQKMNLDAALHYLDQTVAWAGENHMYVIVDFHSIGWLPGNWYPDANNTTTIAQWTEFWKTISSRYVNNDIVAFYELFNEPQIQERPWELDRAAIKKDWTIWKGLVEDLINNTIRHNDPQKIVLVGGLQNAYNLSYVASSPIEDISHNVAYAEHPYPHQELDFSGVSSLSDWDVAFGTLSDHYPVFATEFGYDSIGWPGSDPEYGILRTPYHQVIVDYLEKHKISWAVWGFSANWTPGLLKDNKTFEPSESGTYFRSRLLELNGRT
jgi:endoglucanase